MRNRIITMIKAIASSAYNIGFPVSTLFSTDKEAGVLSIPLVGLKVCSKLINEKDFS